MFLRKLGERTIVSISLICWLCLSPISSMAETSIFIENNFKLFIGGKHERYNSDLRDSFVFDKNTEDDERVYHVLHFNCASRGLSWRIRYAGDLNNFEAKVYLRFWKKSPRKLLKTYTELAEHFQITPVQMYGLSSAHPKLLEARAIIRDRLSSTSWVNVNGRNYTTLTPQLFPMSECKTADGNEGFIEVIGANFTKIGKDQRSEAEILGTTLEKYKNDNSDLRAKISTLENQISRQNGSNSGNNNSNASNNSSSSVYIKYKRGVHRDCGGQSAFINNNSNRRVNVKYEVSRDRGKWITWSASVGAKSEYSIGCTKLNPVGTQRYRIKSFR